MRPPIHPQLAQYLVPPTVQVFPTALTKSPKSRKFELLPCPLPTLCNTSLFPHASVYRRHLFSERDAPSLLCVSPRTRLTAETQLVMQSFANAAVTDTLVTWSNAAAQVCFSSWRARMSRAAGSHGKWSHFLLCLEVSGGGV